MMNIFTRILNYLSLHIMALYGGFIRRAYFHDSVNADKVNEKFLMDLVRRSRNTEYGKKYGFDQIKSVRDYQDRVPLNTYDDFKDYINRTVNTGEQNILVGEKIEFFAKTSGTTGVTKRIPVVKKAIRPYFKTVALNMWVICKEMKRRGFHTGKGLNTVESEANATPSGIPEGLISSYTINSGKEFIPIITCFPKEIYGYGDDVDMKYIKARYSLQEKNMTFIAAVFLSTTNDLMRYINDNQDMLIRDIEFGTINEKINLPAELREALLRKMKPDPERATELKIVFNEESDEPFALRIWPKLSVIIGIGTGEFAPFAKKLRNMCGDEVKFFNETYSCSEALIANAMDVEDDNYFLLNDGGFFEFIPVDDPFDEEKDRPLLAHELEVGKHYEVVITNRSGLYRYRFYDVILVTGFKNKTPLLHFAYRKNQVINISGVKLTTEHVLSTIKAFEERTGIHIAEYALYPDTDSVPWRLIVFIETDTAIPESLEKDISRIFDEELSKVNKEHGRMLKIGETSPSVVCRVNNGTFAGLRQMRINNGANSNQMKTVRVISDPEQLAFLKDSADTVYH